MGGQCPDHPMGKMPYNGFGGLVKPLTNRLPSASEVSPAAGPTNK